MHAQAQRGLSPHSTAGTWGLGLPPPPAGRCSASSWGLLLPVQGIYPLGGSREELWGCTCSERVLGNTGRDPLLSETTDTQKGDNATEGRDCLRAGLRTL